MPLSLRVPAQRGTEQASPEEPFRQGVQWELRPGHTAFICAGKSIQRWKKHPALGSSSYLSSDRGSSDQSSRTGLPPSAFPHTQGKGSTGLQGWGGACCSVRFPVEKLCNERVTELGPREPPKAPVSCLGDCEGLGCGLLKSPKIL